MYGAPATKGRRIGAYLIDGVILMVIQIPFILLAGGPGILLGWVLMVGYYGVTEGSTMSASLGKYLCGIMVVDNQGKPLNYSQAFVRALYRLISSLILGIGFLIGLFSSDGRTLHDRLAGTLVIMKEAGNADNFHGRRTVIGEGHGDRTFEIPGNQPRAQIVGVTGFFVGQIYPVTERGVILGRDRSVCDVYVSNDQQGQGISRTHCKVKYNPQSQMLILYDLGSTYGTFLGNGVRVAQGRPIALRSGDEFYLATRSNTFRVELH